MAMSTPSRAVTRGESTAPSSLTTIQPVAGSRPVHAERTGALLTASSAVFFGSLAIYGKFAERMGISTTELLAIRFGLAALILWLVAAWRRERLWWGRRSLGLVLMGLLYVGQAGAYFTSLQTVPAAVTSILLYLYPVIVMVLAALFLGESLTRVRLAALVIAGIGVFAVIDPLSAHGSIDSSGAALRPGHGSDLRHLHPHGPGADA